MKVEIRKFKFQDYVRFLRTKLNPKTRREFAKSPLGYFIVALKDFTSKIKVYKFSVFADGKFVGFGAVYNERGFDEMRIFTLPKYRGRGIATEATRQMIDFCFKDLGLKSIKTVIDEENPEPELIMKKLGFKLIKKNPEKKIRIWEKKNEK